MRKRSVVLIATSLAISLITVDAFAQPGSRLRGRRLFGGGLRQNAPEPSPQSGGEVRENGQLRQGLQNLGGKLIESGALESILGQAGSPVPQLPTVTPQFSETVAADLASRAELQAQFSGKEPFTQTWYAAHPHAWKFPDSQADAWAVASIATAAAWVGIVEPPSAEASAEQADAIEKPVVVASAVLPAGDYLPLGVFALTPAGGKDPSALLQLAIGKAGQIEGNYYDIVTGAALPLSGSLDKHTQLATLKIASPGAVEFEVALVSLSRADGSIRLRFSGGQVSDWHLARYESNPAVTAPAVTPD